MTRTATIFKYIHELSVNATKNTHPPIPPFVYAVGVTGHRKLDPETLPNINQAATAILASIRTEADKQLSAVPRGLFRGGGAVLRCVSPLAEGADRIVARQALAQGYDLQVPLPFFQEDYEKDFAGQSSKQEFRDLLSQASAVLELGDIRGPQADAYHSVGQVVLEQSDLLIAVWDGTTAKGRGGTGQIVATAEEHGIPVLIINPADPTDIRFHAACESKDWKTALSDSLRRVILPPTPDTDAPALTWKERLKDWFTGGVAESTSPSHYFGETLPKATLLGQFPLWFEKVLAAETREKEDDPSVAAGFWKTWTAGWARWCAGRSRAATAPAPCRSPQSWSALIDPGHRNVPAAEDLLSEQYGWADMLAVHYATRYRAIGFLRHLLMLFVMIGVFFGFYVKRFEVVGFGLEVLGFAAILVLVRINTVQNWHQRLLDYRYIAEQVRHLQFLCVLGCVPAFVHGEGDTTCSQKNWPVWYLRNVARQIGLVQAKMEPDLLEKYRRKLDTDVLDQQIYFYKNRQNRYTVIARRLNSFGIWCFILGLGFILLRCLLFWWIKDTTSLMFGYTGSSVRTTLNVIALVIPSLASMAFAIRAQGEYVALSAQYALAGMTLVNRRQRLGAMSPLTRNKLATFSQKLAATLSSEVSGWHGLVKSKALRPY